MIVIWAKGDDGLITDMKNPAKWLAAGANVTRARKHQMRDACAEPSLPRCLSKTQNLPAETQCCTLKRQPWQSAAKMLSEAEMARRGNINSQWLPHCIKERRVAFRVYVCSTRANQNQMDLASDHPVRRRALTHHGWQRHFGLERSVRVVVFRDGPIFMSAGSAGLGSLLASQSDFRGRGTSKAGPAVRTVGASGLASL